jgi:catechol 2,3-dioxygenase-like lactoylglutathione lyase family enzyme
LEIAMIGYVTLGTNKLPQAKAYFEAVLKPLGVTPVFGNDRFQGYVSGGSMLAVCLPFDGGPATVGNGGMVALRAPSHEVVREVYDLALANGGRDEGPPGERLRGYYAYFRDLDGNKICVFKARGDIVAALAEATSREAKDRRAASAVSEG